MSISYDYRCYNIIYSQYQQLFNLLLFTQSLSYFKTHKFKSVPKVFIKKLCTLNLKRLKEDTVLIFRDNRFHITAPIICIENLRVLALAKLGLKFASERKIVWS